MNITSEDNATQQDELLATLLPKLDTLRNALEQEHPDIKHWIEDINKDLNQYPDLVHILDDEQIGTLYKAIIKESKEVIVTKTTKKAVKSAKKDGILPSGQHVADLL